MKLKMHLVMLNYGGLNVKFISGDIFKLFIKHDGEPLEDSDGEKVPAKKKKTHKKAKTKTKGKSRARAASPSRGESGSDEESEPVHKSHKKKVASGSRRW